MKNILLPSAIALSLAFAFPIQITNAATTTAQPSAATSHQRKSRRSAITRTLGAVVIR